MDKERKVTHTQKCGLESGAAYNREITVIIPVHNGCLLLLLESEIVGYVLGSAKKVAYIMFLPFPPGWNKCWMEEFVKMQKLN